MKILLTLSLLMMTCLTHAQSFLIFQNGVLLSTNEQGLVFDFNQFIRINELITKGKNYFIDKNNALTVISQDGYVFSKGDKFAPKKLKANGGVYVLGSKGELMVVTKEGYVYTYDKEDRLNKLDVSLTGGNFLTLKGKKAEESIIVTINEQNGLYSIFSNQDLKDLKLDINKIAVAGGNYFVTTDGVLHTVSKDGLIFSKASMGNFSNLKTKGGNYFIENNGTLRVVLNNGYLLVPYLPANMGSVKMIGYNYFINSNDQLITVKEKVDEAIINSTDAVIFDAALKTLVNLFDGNFDGRMTRVLSL